MEGLESAVSRMKAAPLYEKLSDAEKAFHDAMISIADKYGKFSEDNPNNIFPSYENPAQNKDSKIGVKCGNCSFYADEGNCKLLSQKVDLNGRCRFANIPPGYVKGY